MTLDFCSFCFHFAATAGMHHHHPYVAPGNQTQVSVNATKAFCQSNRAVFLAWNILEMWYFLWIALTLILVCFGPPSLPPSNKHTNTNHRLGFSESLIFWNTFISRSQSLPWGWRKENVFVIVMFPRICQPWHLTDTWLRTSLCYN